MTEEHAKLLLKDLSARLPYGVKLQILSWDDVNMEYIDKADALYSINSDNHVRTSTEDQDFYIDEVKPYLFPMSSMTEEQENEYVATFVTIVYEDGSRDNTMTCESFDWLNKHMFDYRGLIPLGLAKDATGLGIY